MINTFIVFRFIDLIDILLVAFLMYQLYILIKDTLAIHIFVAVIAIILLWKIVDVTQMKLLGSILGQIIGVGAIAVIVLFQQELRRFMVLIGSRYFSNYRFNLDNLLIVNPRKEDITVRISSIVKACINMAKNKTGALIVLRRKSHIYNFVETGDRLDANTSSRLIESIFNRQSPLHDGALIIINDKLIAARCVLPISENFNLPPNYGLRHRAGIGITEQTDALVVIISEETGEISLAEKGKIKRVDSKILYRTLEKEFGLKQQNNI